MYLLTHAAREETEVTFKGQKMKLKPGQDTDDSVADSAMPSRKRDRICRICSMTGDRLIAKKSDRRFTFITVLEWDLMHYRTAFT